MSVAPAIIPASDTSPFVALKIDGDLATALHRAGHGRGEDVLLAGFAVLLYRQPDGAAGNFALTAGDGQQIDLSLNPLMSDVLMRVHPATQPHDNAARTAFYFAHYAGAAFQTRDLAVCADLRDGTVNLRWHFNRAVFDRETIGHLCAQYVCLLDAIVSDAQRPISRLPLMSAQKRLAVLDFGRGVQTRYERNATIDGRFSEQARCTPNAVAIHDGHRRLTYAEVELSANRLANYLSSRGVAAGMPIGVAFERSAQLPVTLLAILKMGAIYVPLDTSYPADRIAFMLEDAGVCFVIACDALCDLWPYERAPVIVLSACAHDVAHASNVTPAIASTAESLAYIVYTSGSTGRPKGVAVPHRGVLRLVRGADYLDVIASDVFLQFAPLAFDASTFELWAPLLNGAQLCIPRSGLLSIEDLAAEVERYGVTTMFLTTSLFGRVAQSALPAFHRLRRLLTGGDVASPALMRRFIETYPGCRLAAVYGPTENTTFSTWCELPTAAAIGLNVPIGRPIANSTAYVLDAQLEPVPLGVIGELCVGGDGIAHGYLKLADQTAEKFLPDPFSDSSTAMLYRTGDRARFRADGVLEFHGRSDDQIKIRGFRIELSEIEAALGAIAGVAVAAVIAIEREPGEKSLEAYIVPVAGARITQSDLRDDLRNTLPPFMLPHRITIVAALPLHRSGKIDRLTLARQFASSQNQVTEIATRRARPVADVPAEVSIAQLWMSILHLPAVPDEATNFFDAGGDSLQLLRLLTSLNERYTVDLSVVDLFEHTTIEAQASLIRDRSKT